MGWLGKVVGGTIGFAVGGPLGAIAGAAFGHAFDRSNVQTYAPDSARLSSAETAQFTFFVATFSMLAKLAKADGQVSKEEIASIEKFMTQDLNLSAESRKVAIDIFRAALDSPEHFNDFATQFYNQFRFQPRILEFMIEILLRVSIADGQMSAREEQLILSAVRIFNLSDEQYQTIKSEYIQASDKYYAVLKCKPDDSDEHIKKQYRKLVRDFHPDTIASKGLPEEFNQFAHEKFREIQQAYDGLKKERGMV